MVTNSLTQITSLLNLKKEDKYIYTPKNEFEKFIHNTSIGTSTMIMERAISKGFYFINTPICEDYFFKCQILKKVKEGHCLNKFLTRYRIRKGSLQSSKIKIFIGYGK